MDDECYLSWKIQFSIQNPIERDKLIKEIIKVLEPLLHRAYIFIIPKYHDCFPESNHQQFVEGDDYQFKSYTGKMGDEWVTINPLRERLTAVNKSADE